MDGHGCKDRTRWSCRELRSSLRDNIAKEIEAKKRAQSKPYVSFAHVTKHTRWQPGVCLICNEGFIMLTNSHAKNHGYNTADELIADNKIKWCY